MILHTDTWTTLQNTPNAVNNGGSLVYTGGIFIYVFRGGGFNNFWRYDITSNYGHQCKMLHQQ
jgi:hypothetical protein